MLKRMSIKKIMVSSCAILLLLIIYLIPDNKREINLKQDKIEYSYNNVVSTIYLVDRNNYVARTSIPSCKCEGVDKAKDLVEGLIIDGNKSSIIPNGFRSIIPPSVRILNLSLDNSILTIDFSKDILDVSEREEKKMLEAIIYTLTSIDGIDKIIIKVEGEVLNNLPKSGESLPSVLDKSYGINKTYDLVNTSDIDSYTLYYVNKYNNNVNYNNLNIGIDASNGASSKVCEYIFSKLGSKYHIINNAPNGTNINNNCGSTHPEVLSSYVINNKLDIGIAYDGDADRVVFIDELGNIINGDYTLAIISNDLKNKNRLNKNTIVGTILSNLGLLEYCKNNDIEFITTNVGDKYVLEYLRDNNLSLGGEEAGHIILKEYCNTGDGPLTSLIMLSILASTNTTFSNLTKIMHKYPEVHINIKVNNKNDFATSNIIEDSIKEIKNNFNGNYRLVVRPSGTEPLVRIVLEGEELKVLEESSNKIKSIIKNLNMEVV